MKALQLIRALEATGKSPYRISKESGIPQPTISRIIAGQPDCLASTLRKLEELCQASGIDLDAMSRSDQVA